MKDVWGHSGSMNQSLSEFEIRHRILAREAAAEGIVLLKNEGQLLPLAEGTTLNLFGKGVNQFRTSAVGAGKINPRYTIDLLTVPVM